MVKNEVDEVIIKMTKEEIICKVLIFFILFLIFLYYLIMIFFNCYSISSGFYQHYYHYYSVNYPFKLLHIDYSIFCLKANLLIFILTILLEFFSKNKKENIVIYLIFLLFLISPLVLFAIHFSTYNWPCITYLGDKLG